jgi:predicted RNA binding protein YcfA (HicA-like mRNA interferase family)
MSRAPRITGNNLIRVLEVLGFAVIRVRGSHHFLRHTDGRGTVVPAHAGEIIGPGLLQKVLRDCQVSVEDLRRLL